MKQWLKPGDNLPMNIINRIGELADTRPDWYYSVAYDSKRNTHYACAISKELHAKNVHYAEYHPISAWADSV